jgi:putative FmdB family regulatory protein
MPIYEYQCSSCQKVIEVMQRITEEPLSHCPDCHGSVKKLVSMSAFHLKGGGWFADGYSGSPGNNGKSSGKGNGSASESVSKAGDKKSSSSNKVDSKSSSTPKNSQTAASQ